MRTTVYLLIVVAFALVSFSSCDKIDWPHIQASVVNPHTSDTIFRKILLEDYTGFRCGTCPPAAVTLYSSLVPLYGDDLITISVHASASSNFTSPVTPGDAPVGSFLTDFRTPAGEAWLAFFGINANPMGMVSRLDYPTNNHIKSAGAWGGSVQSIYRQLSKFQIEITNQYDNSSGNLDCKVKVKVLKPVSDTYSLSVVLTEDSIIDWQTWYGHTPKYIPDYIHRHVLRGAINGNFGDQVISGSAAVNDSSVNMYSVNLQNMPATMNPLNPTLNIAHCHVVAFVYETTTKEIWQAEEEEVQ